MKKVTNCECCNNYIYDDYYDADPYSDDRRLYDLNRRLKKLVPEIEGCLKTHIGTGYSIQFSNYK